jgi:hypothetical protein
MPVGRYLFRRLKGGLKRVIDVLTKILIIATGVALGLIIFQALL